MKIALIAGGTGGHIFPALAVEKELKNRGIEKLIFLVSATSLASWILTPEMISLPRGGLMGKGVVEKTKGLISIIQGLFKSLKLIEKEQPGMACGFGGYGSVAFLLACRLKGVPFILHEQNLLPGRATRFLSKFAQEVLISFPESVDYLPLNKTFFSGNPCRKEFANYHQSLGNSGYEPKAKKIILVIGGSQGSHFLNQNLPGPLLRFLDDFPDLTLVHLCGQKEREEVSKKYLSRASRVEVIDFSPDVSKWLKEARLVISRAGATILSEICLMAVPAILIPFARAADNHQYYNALWFKERGGAAIIEEANFSGEYFYHLLKELLDSPARLKEMSASLIKLAKPDAAKIMADRILRNSLTEKANRLIAKFRI